MNKLLIAFQAGLFYIIPYLIGWAVLTLKNKKRIEVEDVVGKNQSFLKFGERFALGTLALFGLAGFVRYVLEPILTVDFQKLYFPLVWILTSLSIFAILHFRSFKGLTITKEKIGVLTLALALSVSVYGFWYYKSPYSLNWDYYQHQTLARLIQDGKFDLFTTKISDTFGFNSYPPTFHLLLAASQFPAKLSVDYVVNYWNIIGFYHLVLVGLASYVLGLAISKRKEVGLISLIVGIITFDSITSFTNLFLLPQTLAATTFIFLLSNLIADREEFRKPSFLINLAGVLFLVAMHYLVGIFAALILAVSYIAIRFENKVKLALKSFPFVYLIPVIVVVGIFLSNILDLSFLNRGEARYYIYDLSAKAEFVQRIYGYALLLFTLPGVFFAISRRRWEYNLTLILLFGFAGILYSNFPYVMKFYVLARFFVHLFVALGIWSILKHIKAPLLRFTAYLLTVVTFAILLLFNVIFWKNWISYQDQYTHISDYDIEASEFLADRYKNGEEIILISDPATQIIFEGLSGVDSAGGGFMTSENRLLLYDGLKAGNVSLSKEYFEKINDRILKNPNIKLIALSGRTFAWLDFSPEDRYRFDSNVWSPKELSYWDVVKLSSFETSNDFSLVYKSPYVWIFELKN